MLVGKDTCADQVKLVVAALKHEFEQNKKFFQYLVPFYCTEAHEYQLLSYWCEDPDSPVI